MHPDSIGAPATVYRFDSDPGHKGPDEISGPFVLMCFFVYVLYSEAFDKFYVGQTNDIENRLARHNSGSVQATQPYRPWVLKWYVEKDSRAEAMKLEKKLKNLSKQKLIAFIQKYS
ncbi:MAG: GIY-YIG nuclease family protein [Chitinophagaceae bacterium]|nr:GIY-YIG nuclease family protein [Chitinophagaceae bacterium]